MKSVIILSSTLLLAAATLAQTDAKTNFEQKCATCHGPDGKAQTPMAKKMGAPDLTSAAIQEHTNAQIRSQIADGKGKMPPYGGILGTSGVDEMVKYVRTLGPQSAKKSAPKAPTK